MKLNQVIVIDSNLPLFANEFSEEFAVCTISSLTDFFLRYDQVKLNKESGDFTVFITPLELIQMTTLP